jgi:wyosine [tRNA(Phe)-imidazoG37] synthetase (radical SAM superfamily)
LINQYKYLFGPVPSRRFGRSLGVDLTPYKTCTQDCVFCQLGRTTDLTVSRDEYVPVDEVIGELGAWFKTKGRADYITLSGSGEPTLHSRFHEVIRFIREYSAIKTVLLTNGSLLHIPEVRSGASRAHIVKVSLSAWDQRSYGWINRPHPAIKFKRFIDGIKTFRTQFTGEFWIEVFLIWGVNSTPSDVSRIAVLAEEIGPDRIQLNTVVRPPVEDFAEAVPEEHAISLCPLFRPTAEIIADFNSSKDYELPANKETILAMLRRRPCTADQIAKVFGMHLNEVSKCLGSLMQDGQIREERKSGDIYYAYKKTANIMQSHIKALFQTDGCGASAVCGSFTAELAIGKTPDELIEVTGEEILKVLGRFPKEDRHCCFLAAGTLQEALNDYMVGQTKKTKQAKEGEPRYPIEHAGR